MADDFESSKNKFRKMVLLLAKKSLIDPAVGDNALVQFDRLLSREGNELRALMTPLLVWTIFTGKF